MLELDELKELHDKAYERGQVPRAPSSTYRKSVLGFRGARWFVPASCLPLAVAVAEVTIPAHPGAII